MAQQRDEQPPDQDADDRRRDLARRSDDLRQRAGELRKRRDEVEAALVRTARDIAVTEERVADTLNHIASSRPEDRERLRLVSETPAGSRSRSMLGPQGEGRQP
ncbi:hypothetical protein ACI8AA_12115 [Geodermatophilus sp. SYSU D01180]